MKAALTTLHCALLSAENILYDKPATFVAVTGCEGELGIAAGHAPLLTALPPGHVRIVDVHHDEHVYFVEGGFVEVQPNGVTILADTVLRADDIDLEAAQKAREAALRHLRQATDRFDYPKAAHELLEAMARIEAVQLARRSRSKPGAGKS